MGVRERAKAAYRDLLDVRLRVLAVLGWCMRSRSGQPGRTNPSISQRLTLIASFVQGLNFVERLITEGYYIRAAALLKQDVETLARIEECKKGLATDGRTPNVKHIPNIGRSYGELNEAAHVAVPDVLKNLLFSLHAEEVHGVSSVPTLVEEAAVGLYRLHCFLSWRMALEALLLHWEMYGDEVDVQLAFQNLFAAADILVNHGVISGLGNPPAPPPP